MRTNFLWPCYDSFQLKQSRTAFLTIFLTSLVVVHSLCIMTPGNLNMRREDADITTFLFSAPLDHQPCLPFSLLLTPWVHLTWKYSHGQTFQCIVLYSYCALTFDHRACLPKTFLYSLLWVHLTWRNCVYMVRNCILLTSYISLDQWPQSLSSLHYSLGCIWIPPGCIRLGSIASRCQLHQDRLWGCLHETFSTNYVSQLTKVKLNLFIADKSILDSFSSGLRNYKMRIQKCS